MKRLSRRKGIWRRSLLSSLLALTHVLKSCVESGEWADFDVLLRERERLITNLASSGASLGRDEVARILEADEALTQAAARRRLNLGGQLRQLGSIKKVRSAYRPSA